MISAGKIEYQQDAHPCVGVGLSFTDAELDSAIETHVAAIAFDDVGNEEAKALLSGLAETDFEFKEIEKIFEAQTYIEDWRVGEAIAEAFLSEHHSCMFPWPDGRDERKRGSSLPGADLVGLHLKDAEPRFAFGEVKTSSEQKYPPNAVHGASGLHHQLEDLRDKTQVRQDLVKYLCHRARGKDWAKVFQEATKRFLINNSDVRLFGVLVRSVLPHENDLKNRITKLAANCPTATEVMLLALYLPQGSIETLGKKTVAAQAGKKKQ